MKPNITLDRDFERCLDEMRSKYGEKFEYINGVHPTQLDYSVFMNKFKETDTLADVSSDPSANARNLDLRSFLSEKDKPYNKIFGMSKIFYEVKKKWGLKTAKEWYEQEYSKGYYLNDASASSSFFPYCYAVDLSRLAREGLFFLKDYNAQPPKHLTTFLDDVIEFVSYLSNRQSGAVGLPNIVVWMWYFWHKDCENGYYIKDPEYYYKQSVQKLIYRLNQPFLRIDQSSFTNVSIFDRCYLEALFGALEFPDGSFGIDHIEEIIEAEKSFMEVVVEIRKETMFTYPVFTYSLLYKDGKFQDEEFARWCSDTNVEWADSNFFVSDNVGVLSNCPLHPDTLVQYHSVDTEQKGVAKISDVFAYAKESKSNSIYLYNGGNRVLCEINKFEIPSTYKITLENGAVVTMTANHLNYTKKDVYIKAKDLTCDDYFYVISNKDGKEEREWVRIKKIEKGVYSKESYCARVLADDVEPLFTLANGVLTHNCRLLSDTSKLSGFINSIGGTALSIGSVRVNTINLVRIAYESNLNEEEYLRILKDRVVLDCKVLYSIRHIIKRNIEKGLLPNYQEGALELDKQYCTIGILGLYEVMDLFGLIKEDELGNKYYTDEGIDFATRIFHVINEIKDSFTDEFSYNVESIPGENCAGTICAADNLLFDSDKYYIYSNQWVPLREKCTLAEKCKLSAILDQKCSGGAIAHINIEGRFSNKDMAWDMLNYVAQQGVIYFAFNTKISVCKHRHAFIGTDKCPQCGEPVADTFTRVVGFYTPVSGYQAIRRREFDERKWYNLKDGVMQ